MSQNFPFEPWPSAGYSLKKALPGVGLWFRVLGRSGVADEKFAWPTKVVQNGKKGTTYRPDYTGARDPSLKVTSDGLNTVIRRGAHGVDPGDWPIRRVEDARLLQLELVGDEFQDHVCQPR